MPVFAKIIGDNHHYSYKIGLNVLNQPFSEKPVCGPGGLYFCTIDQILQYINYGTQIALVEPAVDAQVVQTKPHEFKTDRLVVLEVRDLLDISTFEWLQEHGVDLNAEKGELFAQAISTLSTSVLRWLLDNGADVHAYQDCAVRKAATKGRLDLVKFLVSHGADPRAGNDYAMRWAAIRGHLEIVQYLVDQHGADVKTHQDELLQWVALNGHFSMVQYLVKNGAHNKTALVWARANRKHDVAEYLEGSL